MKADEFIREVDEELQRDRMAALWQRWGSWVIAAAVLLVAVVAGINGWRAWQERARKAEAVSFAAAERLLAESRPADAAQAFETIARSADSGFAQLARLAEAEARLAAGDRAGAATALEPLASDSSADPLLRELANLLIAAHRIDTADPNDLRSRLEPLAAPRSPWRHTARELLATLALRTGDEARARGLLEELVKDAGTPAAQRRRIEQLLQALGGGTKGASS